MAWRPPQQPGDSDPAVAEAKRALRKYSYGQGLGESEEYTVAFGVALVQFQTNVHGLVIWERRPGPDVNTSGVLDWATKKQLGILPEKPETLLPVGFSVAGHMSAWDDGPAWFTTRQIEVEGFCRAQGVGYDNVALPFRNGTGVEELDRLFHDPVVLPSGADSFVVAHSQGGIVVGDWWLDRAAPRINEWPYSSIKAVVVYGNPYRGVDQVAPWIETPPAPGTGGISNRRVEDPPPFWWECSNHGDLYAENEIGTSMAEYKTAIYRAVQNQWFGPGDTLAEQIQEIVTGGPSELWAVAQAIISGLRFVGNMGPHAIFDLRFPIHQIKKHLGVV